MFIQHSAQSLRDLERVWIADVQASLKDALLILVGNKADVDDEVRTRSQRQVTKEDAAAFKDKHKLHYNTEVSAKTGHGIKELVERIAKTLYHINQDNLANFKGSEGQTKAG